MTFPLMPLLMPVRKLRRTFVGSATQSPNTATHTYTAQGIGVAAVDRLVVVGIGARDGGTRAVSGVTIGGVAAGLTAVGPSGNQPSAIAYLVVKAGTTADIVVSFSGGAVARSAIYVWTLYGWQSTTPFHNALGGGGLTSTATLNIPHGGVGLAVITKNAITDLSWAGVTEDAETDMGAGAGAGAASSQNMTAETGRAISATSSSSVQSSLSAASWR
jgi:hypothetical protein